MISVENIKLQIPHTLKATDFTNLGAKYEGKVRDNYTREAIDGSGRERVIIVTDRLSAFDRVITAVPFKGQVLNQMAAFWFEQTKDIIANHVKSVPDANVMIGRECVGMPLEMVVRGYLTGVTTTSVWHHYKNGGRNFCGNVLPEGMKKDQKFAEPILTPSTKAEHGGHDESIAGEEIVARGLVTADEYKFMASAALKLYARGVEIAAKQGIILVDTKYEFGRAPDGSIILIDEIHTPDSSRFWFADSYQSLFEAGEEQRKIDKEYLRKWLADQGFVGEGEIPAIPEEIVAETARRYIEAYELITGQEFKAEVGDVLSRIKQNLGLN